MTETNPIPTHANPESNNSFASGISSPNLSTHDNYGQPLSANDVDDTLAKERSLTFGEKLVGLNFNPANDDKVGKAKALCAVLADLLYNDSQGQETTALYDRLYHHTIGEILNAQMNVVKVLTLKY